MKRFPLIVAVASSVCAGMLAGCGSAGSVVNPPAATMQSAPVSPLSLLPRTRRGGHITSWMAPEARSAPLAYVADAGNNVVDVYSQTSLKLVGQLTTNVAAPVGLATDSSGGLYVASVHPQDVIVYAKGATRPKRILFDANQPSSVAVGSDGTVYVATDSSLASNVTGVDVFAKGQVAPSYTITDSQYVGIWAVGVDAAGNLYVGGEGNSGSGLVKKFAPKARVGKNLKLKGLVFPTSLALDPHGDLFVADFQASDVDEYAPNTTAPAFAVRSKKVAFLARDPRAKRLWLPVYGGNVVNIVSYPGGAKVASIVVAGKGVSLTGVALTPSSNHP